MKKLLLVLFVACSVYGQQQKYVAIINTVDDGDVPVNHSELNYLTDRLREIAVKNLPQKVYAVMTQQSIVAFLGSLEETAKKCRESEGCLAKLGREINADYIGQGRIGRFGGKFTIKVEVYDVRIGNLISSFTGSAKDIHGLLSILDKEAVNMFKKISIGAEQEENTIVDSRDGKKYKTTHIGSQVWMAENLNFDYKGSKCYDNKLEYCKKYGRLYNWETAKKACPTGWHLPSDEEWDILYKFVDNNYEADDYNSKIASMHLRASGWNKGSNSTNKYSFAALPGGSGYSGGDFRRIGDDGNWWSASEYGKDDAYFRNMIYEYTRKNAAGKLYMFSVRCIKD